MATLCIQCALEAYVASGGDAAKTRKASSFDEEPEAHRLRVHPDLKETQRRRRELEHEFARINGGTMIYPDEN